MSRYAVSFNFHLVTVLNVYYNINIEYYFMFGTIRVELGKRIGSVLCINVNVFSFANVVNVPYRY